MKLTILFLLFTHLSFAQLSDRNEAQKFWDDNINNIVLLKTDQILAQTQFPLNVHLGTVTQKWTKEIFQKKLPNVFTMDVREQLKEMSIDDIDAWVMSDDESETYMLVCYFEEGEYAAVVLSFKQMEGPWKLYGLDYQIE